MKKFLLGLLAGVLLGGSAIVLAQNTVSFPDVKQDAYYAPAVGMMSDLGVIKGYDNGNFGPDDMVTRGQIATMLQRYDDSIKLLVDDYCTNHKLQMGQMATLYYQNLCINRGYSAYILPQTQETQSTEQSQQTQQ
jgi:hypothetical protein